MTTIDTDTIDALRAYANAHGRGWKAALRADWTRSAAGPALQALRNSHGPSWLAGYRLPA